MWNEPRKERLNKIPKLYETEHVPLNDKLIHLHFFIGGSDWFVCEYDGDDLFWGYAILNNDFHMAEWGYFSLSELKTISLNGIEIDCELEQYFPVRKASKISRICKASNWHQKTNRHKKQAGWDSVMEFECPKCGGEIVAEPDATDLYCEECKMIVIQNPLTALGFI